MGVASILKKAWFKSVTLVPRAQKAINFSALLDSLRLNSSLYLVDINFISTSNRFQDTKQFYLLRIKAWKMTGKYHYTAHALAINFSNSCHFISI